jgi:hypothetical protein
MIERVDALIAAREPTAPGWLAGDLAALRLRLREPVRIAVVGRVKAGKSTLVNALLGQQIAPTDISECTRVVTWFHYGHPQRLVIETKSGERLDRQLGADQRLPEELGIPLEDVAALHVHLANETLRSMTLIDTPGIGSVNSGYSAATESLLAERTADAAGRADAVLFLLNQVMMEDELATLQLFHSASADAAGSAANAVGLLSRADQIGDGSKDPWQVAIELAGHFAGVFKKEVATVVPVVGLLAEAAEAATLTESDVEALKALLTLDASALRRLSWSADRFIEADAPVSREQRERLLTHLDMYGVSRSLAFLREQPEGATGLRRWLSEVSGIGAVKATLRTYFHEQDHVLKVRSALDQLSQLTFNPAGGSDPAVTRLRADVEQLRLDPSMHPVSELEAWHQCCTGVVSFEEPVLVELGRLLAPGPPRRRLGCRDDEDPLEVARAALQRWRAFMNTDATPAQARVARVALRSYQLIWKDLSDVR